MASDHGFTISTHVLDTARGAPAAGVAVSLDAPGADGAWATLEEAVTDADGRAGPLAGGDPPGPRRLVFDTRAHAAFFPEVAIAFLPAPDEHTHVPLLLSPYGYTTYRGS